MATRAFPPVDFARVLAGEPSALVVVGPDERRNLQLVVRGSFGVDTCVHDNDGDVREIRLRDCGGNLPRAAGSHDERANAGLEQVLDDLHLLFDVELALGGLHHQLNALSAGRRFGATLHVEEERMVERLHDERDFWRRAGLSRAFTIAAAGESGRGRTESTVRWQAVTCNPSLTADAASAPCPSGPRR